MMKLNYFCVLFFLFEIFNLTFSEGVYKVNIVTGLTDIGNGVGAPDVAVSLYKQEGDDIYKKINTLYTNADGTIGNIAESKQRLLPGVYKLKYNVSSYFESQNRQSFYPHIEVSFNVPDVSDTYLIVILFDAYGFTTYRGSLSKKLDAPSNKRYSRAYFF